MDLKGGQCPIAEFTSISNLQRRYRSFSGVCAKTTPNFQPRILIVSIFNHTNLPLTNYALAANWPTPFVTEWFGAPKEQIEVVELADPEASPFESGSIIFTPLSTSDSGLYQLNAVHLLTHAAFPSPHVWIYEGLAHFAQALDLEQQAGGRQRWILWGRMVHPPQTPKKTGCESQRQGRYIATR